MKFCPVVPEICGGQVHVPRKERRRKRRKRRIIIIKITIRNGAKTITLQTTFGRLNYQHEHIYTGNDKKHWSYKNQERS